MSKQCPFWCVIRHFAFERSFQLHVRLDKAVFILIRYTLRCFWAIQSNTCNAWINRVHLDPLYAVLLLNDRIHYTLILSKQCSCWSIIRFVALQRPWQLHVRHEQTVSWTVIRCVAFERSSQLHVTLEQTVFTLTRYTLRLFWTIQSITLEQTVYSLVFWRKLNWLLNTQISIFDMRD